MMVCTSQDDKLIQAKQVYQGGSYAQAQQIWAPLAEQGNAEAQWGMGILYDSENLGSQDTENAFKWFTLSADKKYTPGQHGLALILTSSAWKGKDTKTAFRLFKEAAEQGYASSQYFVGMFYEKGMEVEKNLEFAKQWYFKAAEQGHERAKTAILRRQANRMAEINTPSITTAKTIDSVC